MRIINLREDDTTYLTPARGRAVRSWRSLQRFLEEGIDVFDSFNRKVIYYGLLENAPADEIELSEMDHECYGDDLDSIIEEYGDTKVIIFDRPAEDFGTMCLYEKEELMLEDLGLHLAPAKRGRRPASITESRRKSHRTLCESQLSDVVRTLRENSYSKNKIRSLLENVLLEEC